MIAKFRCWVFGHKFRRRSREPDGTIVDTYATVDSGPRNDLDRQQCFRCRRWIPTGR